MLKRIKLSNCPKGDDATFCAIFYMCYGKIVPMKLVETNIVKYKIKFKVILKHYTRLLKKIVIIQHMSVLSIFHYSDVFFPVVIHEHNSSNKKGKRNLNQNSEDQTKRAKKAKENEKEEAEENEKEEEI